jgi:hypothetical protein
VELVHGAVRRPLSYAETRKQKAPDNPGLSCQCPTERQRISEQAKLLNLIERRPALPKRHDYLNNSQKSLQVYWRCLRSYLLPKRRRRNSLAGSVCHSTSLIGGLSFPGGEPGNVKLAPRNGDRESGGNCSRMRPTIPLLNLASSSTALGHARLKSQNRCADLSMAARRSSSLPFVNLDKSMTNEDSPPSSTCCTLGID